MALKLSGRHFIEFGFADRANSDKSVGINVTDLAPWKGFMGVEFGWGWVTVNQQGYCDGLLLSFGGMIPQIMLNVIASSIKVGPDRHVWEYLRLTEFAATVAIVRNLDSALNHPCIRQTCDVPARTFA